MSDTPFSFEYSQPEGYHFCQDSVLAPKIVAQDLACDPLPAAASALDVCSGCGVMGFELLHWLGATTSIRQFDFLEVQSDFEPHFRQNLALFGQSHRNISITWIAANYGSLMAPLNSDRYDLIIANPPYFLPEESSLSSSTLNNRARFFLDESPTHLWRALQNALKPGGRAYVLMKSGKQHGRDAFTSARIELFDCQVERLADVRGTDLVKIVKASS